MERRRGLDQVRREEALAHRPLTRVGKAASGVAALPPAKHPGEHRPDDALQGTTTTARQPISERRLAANRANAQKSTGPRTPEGKRRVSKNARRHNLYSKLHHLPEEIADLLYRKALEETADIADPRFRALFVHRLMLRGHERRLLQLEGKLWAEALRVNKGIIPYASLWIRENHAEVVQALGRYHSWICVRIRAIQKSIFPYVIGDVENQTGIPARTQALLASAAGSSRPILLVASTGTTLNPDHQPAFIGAGNPSPFSQPDDDDSAHLAVSTTRNLPPVGGLSSLLTARGGFRPIRPVPAPQAVKAIRPPTVPGLSLRFLNRSRKPSNSTKGKSPTKNHDREAVAALRTAHVSKRAPVAVASSMERALQPPKSKPTLDPPTTPGRRTPRSAVGPLANHPESQPSASIGRSLEPATSAQSTLCGGTKPTPPAQPVPTSEPNRPTTPAPVPEHQRRANSGSCTQPNNQQGTTATQPAQSTLREQTNPTRPATLGLPLPST